MGFIANTVQEDFKNAVMQYNYRFKKKSGEYINLMEQVYILDADSEFRPTLLLGNIITLDNADVLRNLASGKTSKEIGKALYISHHTVDTHRRNLLTKLKCKSVVEFTRVAFKNGLF